MPILDPQELEGVQKPELVFAFVAPVGTPLNFVANSLEDELAARGYAAKLIHLSNFLDGLALPGPRASDAHGPFERINRLMDRGNHLRELTGGGEALALLAAAHINDLRPESESKHLEAHAFLIRQLKHPDEVLWLRRIYGPAFHLIGVNCPTATRRTELLNSGLRAEEADRLIERDEGEEASLGQQLMRTFHHADVFFEFRSHERGNEEVAAQIARFLKLLFGEGTEPPTRDEYAMCFAHYAALRSCDLSRQVGAAILSPKSEVVSVGANEVPCSGGGQYMDKEGDARDVVRGFDANARVVRECLGEILAHFRSDWQDLDETTRSGLVAEHARTLSGTRMMNLTEFGRAVHAEMEAILAAGRVGTSLRGHHLYTTTFPCHNCAKHIVNAGLSRVVYVEPYPKSLARELHHDSIAFAEDAETGSRVLFEPFVGIAPRMYDSVFSMVTPEGRRLRRKKSDGTVSEDPWGLRVKASPLTCIDRETLAAIAAKEIGDLSTSGGV